MTSTMKFLLLLLGLLIYVFASPKPASSNSNFFTENEVVEPTTETARPDIEVDAELTDDVEIRSKRQIWKAAGKWPNGTVYFYFDNIHPELEDVIREGQQYIESRTCINFVEDRTARNRIRVYPADRCYSHIGMVGGLQNLSLNGGCAWSVDTAVHEHLHALGSFHTQQRSDRDEYIAIDETKVDVKGGNWRQMETLNYTPYDFGSIMHYPVSAGFVPKDERYYRTPNSRQISFYDMHMINLHYGCYDLCNKFTAPKCENGGVPNPRDCETCLCPSGYGGRLCGNRPFGCGGIHYAPSTWSGWKPLPTSEYQHAIDRNVYRCNHWIIAPPGKQIQIKVVGMSSDDCNHGCTTSAVEVKTDPDKRITNPRICCKEQFGKVLTSSLNPTPIVSYNKKDDEAYTFIEFRYVDAPSSNYTTTTEAPTIPSNTTAPPSECKDMDPNCPKLIEDGFCGWETPFREKKYKCGKSCGFCGQSDPYCMDFSHFCERMFLLEGGCHRLHPMVAEYECKKTCGYCGFPN